MRQLLRRHDLVYERAAPQWLEGIPLANGQIGAMVWGDGAMLRQAFHPKACCIGHFDGELEWDDLEAFIQGVSGEAAAPGSKPYWRINSMDVTGDMAIVQVENDWAGHRFDDTLTLLFHDDRWQIVSKLFYLRAA